MTRLTRKALLKAGAVGGGAVVGSFIANDLGGASVAAAAPAFTNVHVNAYVHNDSLGLSVLIDAEAPNVAVADDLQGLAVPGRGFDYILDAEPDAKGRNSSWCLLNFFKGVLNWPAGLRGPITSGTTPALRLEGFVKRAVDPSSVGVAVKVHVNSTAAVDANHGICAVRFVFGDFVFTGRGLFQVNQ